jgi:hypothetical protein
VPWRWQSLRVWGRCSVRSSDLRIPNAAAQTLAAPGWAGRELR